MTSILGKMFRDEKPVQADSYETAMRTSDELLEQMRCSQPGPIHQAVSSLWEQRRNIPYVVTIFEATQEMLAPLKQKQQQQR